MSDLERFKSELERRGIVRRVKAAVNLAPIPSTMAWERVVRVQKKATAQELLRLASEDDNFLELFLDAATEALVETAFDPSVFQLDPGFVPNEQERKNMAVAEALATITIKHNLNWR